MERMILCFIEDDFGARHAREIGTDRICIETDYPHSDAIWPNAPERMMEAFAPTDLTDDEINQITHLNAMKFFQYDPFTIRPREKCTVGALRAEAVGHDVSIVAKGRRGRARRADDARGVRRRARLTRDSRARPAQPEVLGRRRRRLPGRARRRPRAARRWRGARSAFPESELQVLGDVRGQRRARARLRRRAVVDRARARSARASSGSTCRARSSRHARAARRRRCRSSPATPSSCRSPTTRSTSCSATTAR